MKNLLKAMLLAVAVLGFATTGCEKKIDVEATANEAADKAKEAADKVEEGAKKVEEGADKVAEKVEEGAEKVEEGAEKVEKAVEGAADGDKKEEPKKPSTSGK